MATDLTKLKIEAAAEALREVKSGMTLGLGTGSTSVEMVKLLGAAMKEGRLTRIRATCTSQKTEELARSLGIPILPLEDLAPLDLAIDGADEVDPKLRLLKGLGGALLREKIVEQAAKRFVVIVDETKLVERLGRGVLPVEVVVFARKMLEKRFQGMGVEPRIRMNGTSELVTDEGHRILDIRIPKDRDVADLVDELTATAGVVDTGFFPTEASEAIIAASSGVRRMKRPPL